jgi:hypothetical protein
LNITLDKEKQRHSESDEIKDLEKILKKLDLVGEEKSLSLPSAPNCPTPTVPDIFWLASIIWALIPPVSAVMPNESTNIEPFMAASPSVTTCNLQSGYQSRMASPQTLPSKRGPKKFYIIITGLQPGIYESWCIIRLYLDLLH